MKSSEPGRRTGRLVCGQLPNVIGYSVGSSGHGVQGNTRCPLVDRICRVTARRDGYSKEIVVEVEV